MIGKDLSQLLLDDILIVEHCVHLSLELVHLLAHRDIMFLCFVLKCVEPHCEVMNLILNRMWRNGIGLLMGCWWWRLSRGLSHVIYFVMSSPIRSLIGPQLLLIRRLILGVIHLLKSWYARLVFLHHYCFYGMYLSLVTFKRHPGFLA